MFATFNEKRRKGGKGERWRERREDKEGGMKTWMEERDKERQKSS